LFTISNFCPYILLVLDGFEDVPYKRAQVVRLNRGGPNSSLITNSYAGRALDLKKLAKLNERLNKELI
jgi:hypothetical protein